MNHLMTLKRYDETKYITGMRAYSALAVFFIHSGGAGLRSLSEFTNNFVDFGKYGVLAFFVISGFTICMSIDSHNFIFGNYIARRFLRIAPLYYVIAIVGFALGGAQYYLEMFSIKNDIWGLLLHLSFLNIFDIRYQNSLIGVEWSVPIEFIYYFAFPFVFFYAKQKDYRILILAISSLLISILSIRITGNFYSVNQTLAFNWSLEKYAFTFACGIITYLIYRKQKINFNTSLFFFSLCIVLGAIIYYNPIAREYYLSVWVGTLILTLSGNNIVGKALFENRIIQYLGDISYSIYLVHFIVLNYLVPKSLNPLQYFFSGLLITIFISSFTYYLIERPFINVGRRFKGETE